MQGFRFIFLMFVLFFIATPLQASLIFDRDLDPGLVKELKSDLSLVSTLQISKPTPLHQEVFGTSSKPYLHWFLDRVTSVGKSLCGADQAVACFLSAWENKIWLTPNYTRFSHPEIARLSVLYHEARHTEREEGFWVHSACPTPFRDESGADIKSIWTGALLQGEPACDVMAKGSYGLQVILLRNLALSCVNCSEKVKADAELYAFDQLKRIIDAQTKKEMKRDLKIGSEFL